MEKNTNILLLECFMRGETSPDEEQILSDWLHSQEAKEQLSNYYQETWKGSNTSSLPKYKDVCLNGSKVKCIMPYKS